MQTGERGDDNKNSCLKRREAQQMQTQRITPRKHVNCEAACLFYNADATHTHTPQEHNQKQYRI